MGVSEAADDDVAAPPRARLALRRVAMQTLAVYRAASVRVFVVSAVVFAAVGALRTWAGVPAGGAPEFDTDEVDAQRILDELVFDQAVRHVGSLGIELVFVPLGLQLVGGVLGGLVAERYGIGRRDGRLPRPDRTLLRLWWADVVVALLGAAPLIVLFAITIAVRPGIEWLLAAFPVAVVWGMVIVIRLALVGPLMTLQPLARRPATIGAALARSHRLLRGSFWRMATILVVPAVAAQIAATALSTGLADLGWNPELSRFLGGWVVNLAVVPLVALAIAVAAYELTAGAARLTPREAAQERPAARRS